MYGYINEKVSLSMMFRGEITLMKKALKNMIKNHKLPYVSADITIDFFGMVQYVGGSVIYKGEPVTYEDSRYYMVGLDMTKFGYESTRGIVEDAKSFFHDYLSSTLIQYCNNRLISRFQESYPRLCDEIKRLGYAHLFSEYYDIKKDEWKAVLDRFEEEYRDGIPGTDDAWVEVFFALHSNGLGIKDNTFMPVFIISLEDGKMYKFVNDRIRYNSYLNGKNINKLVKEGGLTEIEPKDLSKLDSSSYINCPINQAMIQGHLGTDKR